MSYSYTQLLQDPTYEVCRYRDHWNNPLPEDLSAYYPIPFTFNSLGNWSRQIQLSNQPSTSNLVNLDPELYSRLQKLKKSFDFNSQALKQAKQTTNPFAKLGPTHFLDQSVLKLTNLDAIFNVTGNLEGYLRPRDDQSDRNYLDLTGGLGGFIQYLQYRVPKWVGYGFLEKKLSQYKTGAFNLKTFKPLTGTALLNDWSSLVQQIKARVGSVDLTVADGQFGVESDQSEESFSQRLMIQVYLGIELGNLAQGNQWGSSLIVKVYETLTPLSEQILSLVASSYQQVYLFKPVTSDPLSNEKYLIGLNLKRKNHQLIERALGNLQSPDQIVTQLFKTPQDSAYQEFQQWIQQHNNLFLRRQEVFSWRVVSYYQGRTLEESLKVDLHKAYLSWNLPCPPLTL